MKAMTPEVLRVFETYPQHVRAKLLDVRLCISDVEGTLGLVVTETLRWGEPSYAASGGSTLRIAWKSRSPENCYVYFNCKSLLVETFRELYGDLLVFEGNRAIVLKLGEPLPERQLKSCIGMALRYHRIKHLSLLGA